ncbi:hypothetical protein RY831_18850 [Noviherbaspirillum sp. CPCC 100848]|uniref:Uncharacterized protein n=1 Tax=Noviherbaspirillum album TaxID=3080276 RepID=A0ABU6JD93_9BURK|nr:hypothetical protein [Noviherbaspirillum sp. CPCC 100848]
MVNSSQKKADTNNLCFRVWQASPPDGLVHYTSNPDAGDNIIGLQTNSWFSHAKDGQRHPEPFQR